MRKVFFFTTVLGLIISFIVCILIAMSPAPIIVRIIAILTFIEIIKEARDILHIFEQATARDQEKAEHKEAINEMFN